MPQAAADMDTWYPGLQERESQAMPEVKLQAPGLKEGVHKLVIPRLCKGNKKPAERPKHARQDCHTSKDHTNCRQNDFH